MEGELEWVILNMLESCIKRVLHNDPALGIIRHSDAGYDKANNNLKKFNLDI